MNSPQPSALSPQLSLEEWEILDFLTALVDKSLVVYEEDENGQGRYRLLETVRQYTRDRLLENGEGSRYRQQHYDYFLMLTESEPEVGPETDRWFDRLETEYDNLRGALLWSLDDAENAQAGLRLAATMQRLWWVRGPIHEGRQHLADALHRETAKAPTEWRARALNSAGHLARLQGDYTAARTLFEESLAVSQEIEDKMLTAFATRCLGIVAVNQGDYPTAHARFQESLAHYREMGSTWAVALLFNDLGIVAANEGDPDSARSYFEESLAAYRELEDRPSITMALRSLGTLACDQGDYTAAQAHFDEALSLSREVGFTEQIADILHDLGNVSYQQGDMMTARTRYEQSLPLFQRAGNKRRISGALQSLGRLAQKEGDYTAARGFYVQSLTLLREVEDKWSITESLEVFASLALAQQQPERAGRLFGAGATLRAAIRTPQAPTHRAEYDRDLAATRAALGDEAFERAWNTGRVLKMEQAIEFALTEETAP